MKKFTAQLVDELASNLLIGLTSEENKMVLDEFSKIDASLELVTQINNISNVEPMTHCLDNFKYQLREDIPCPSVPVADLLKNCSDKEGDEIIVPKIVG